MGFFFANYFNSFANCLKLSSSWNLCYLELWSGTIQVQSGRSYSIGAHCDQNNNHSLNISFNLILFQPSVRLETTTIATFHSSIFNCLHRFVKCHFFRLQKAFLYKKKVYNKMYVLFVYYVYINELFDEIV